MGNIANNQLNGNNKEQEIQKQVIQPFINGKTPIKYQYESVLQQWLQKRQVQNNQENNQELQLVNKEHYKVDRELFEELNFLEESFNQEAVERIKEHFDDYSFENKMGKKKCLEYFGLLDLQDNDIGNEFFKTVKTVYPKQFSGPYLNYAKFLKTIQMLSQENLKGRIDFAFEFFDQSQNNLITQEDLEKILESFMQLFLEVDFTRDLDFLYLKQNIQKAHYRDKDTAFKRIIQDILQYSNKEANGIQQDGFENWIFSIDGFQDLFKFNPHETYYE